MKRCASALLSLVIALCLLGGCAHSANTEIICGDISLTLPGAFMDLSKESYGAETDFLYGRGSLIVLGLSEKKESLNQMTLEQYTQLLIAENKRTCTPEKRNGGYCFTYEASVGEQMYTYVTATFEDQENFWIVQCYCPREDYGNTQTAIAAILAQILDA